jgi:hypothetical protein
MSLNNASKTRKNRSNKHQEANITEKPESKDNETHTKKDDLPDADKIVSYITNQTLADKDQTFINKVCRFGELTVPTEYDESNPATQLFYEIITDVYKLELEYLHNLNSKEKGK